MKVFQIKDGFCYSEVTSKFRSASKTIGWFPPDVLFVDAPDYVFEGWGYDPTAEGDARFLQPEAPEGWLYDEKTGTFYSEDLDLTAAQVDPITRLEDALCDMDAAQEERLTAVEEALCELDELLSGGTEDA